MKTQFKSHLYKLIEPKDNILLAVSGGVDSMVMAELFLSCHAKFAIAHCNFQLRGKESDLDESFVRNWAEKNRIPVFTTQFDTISESKSTGNGIQEIARKLRYRWFEKLLNENSFDYIATAHHKNDSIETVLFNLSRGTGLKGLTGIQAKRGHLIRPLLIFDKQEILLSGKENKIDYREDQSNSTNKYSRNYIRNKVIPNFLELNSNFEKSMESNIQRFNNLEHLLTFFINKTKNEITQIKNDQLIISKSKLSSLPQPATILFHILKKDGFNFDQCLNIIENLNHPSGNLFYSPLKRLLIDRNELIIEPLSDKISTKENLSANETVKLSIGNLVCSAKSELPEKFENSKHIAYFDAAKLKFPLTIENWKEGDRFAPLGMKGKSKKVKNFLTDEKLSRFQKEKTLVLKSDGKICWVIGHRINEHFKISSNTEACFTIKLKP